MFSEKSSLKTALLWLVKWIVVQGYCYGILQQKFTDKVFEVLNMGEI